MKDTDILEKNENIVTRVIDNERILLPVYRTSEEADCIYTLNTAASDVWEFIDGKKTIGEIKKMILEKYNTTEDEVEKEIGDLLKDFIEIQAVLRAKSEE